MGAQLCGHIHFFPKVQLSSSKTTDSFSRMTLDRETLLQVALSALNGTVNSSSYAIIFPQPTNQSDPLILTSEDLDKYFPDTDKINDFFPTKLAQANGFNFTEQVEDHQQNNSPSFPFLFMISMTLAFLIQYNFLTFLLTNLSIFVDRLFVLMIRQCFKVGIQIYCHPYFWEKAFAYQFVKEIFLLTKNHSSNDFRLDFQRTFNRLEAAEIDGQQIDLAPSTCFLTYSQYSGKLKPFIRAEGPRCPFELLRLVRNKLTHLEENANFQSVNFQEIYELFDTNFPTLFLRVLLVSAHCIPPTDRIWTKYSYYRIVPLLFSHCRLTGSDQPYLLELNTSRTNYPYNVE
jgi:hypothetical protein